MKLIKAPILFRPTKRAQVAGWARRPRVHPEGQRRAHGAQSPAGFNKKGNNNDATSNSNNDNNQNRH